MSRGQSDRIRGGRGFTLVELIVVIIILGILAAVGIPQYRKALERSRGAEGYSGLSSIAQAEKIYYASNEVYIAGASPLSAAVQSSLDISLPQSGWNFGIATGANTFTTTATRKTGPCVNQTMTIDQTGTITDNWKTCVDGL